MSKLISQLPEDIKAVALQRAKDDIMPSKNDNLDMSFFWISTPEGDSIWTEVYNGNYAPFREFHAKQKQPENNGIEDLISEIERRQQMIISEPNGIVRETMIANLLIDLPLPPPPAKN